MPTSRKASFRTQGLQIVDAIVVWLSLWLGWEIRDEILLLLGRGQVESNVRDSVNWILLIAVPFTPLVLEYFGFYDHLRSKTTAKCAAQIFEALVVVLLILGTYALFTKSADTRRLAFASGFIAVFWLLMLRDRLTTMYLRNRCNVAMNRERIIIAGSGSEMQELLDGLDPEVTMTWNVVELFDLETQNEEDLYELLKRESVGRVIFTAKATGFERIARSVEICELQGVEAWIAASFIRTQIARPVFDVIGSKPMLVLRSTPDLSWQLLCKDVFDRVGACLIILASLPLWIIAAVGIALTSPGAPVFFSQQRAGRYGKPFRMWKFRTMVANAEELLAEVRATHGNEMEGPTFKLDNDPRIFTFGRYLRKFSVDELPQLLNVIKGDMSLVGPRPLPLYEVEAFEKMTHRRRLSVKPGVTGEWQAGGRNKIKDFDQWVAMDLRYIDNWSLWLDFTILLRTIPAVLFGRGAK